jgi:hypothetical protein
LTFRLIVWTPTVAEFVVETVISPDPLTVNSVEEREATLASGVSLI